MITLFHSPKTRSSRFLFLLEELGVPYATECVGLRAADGAGAPDNRNPHPHGKVPALRDGDTLVFESSAIALFLTDQYTVNGLGPTVGEATRGSYLSWLAYYSGVLEPALMSKFMNVQVPVRTAGWVDLDDVMGFVLRTLENHAYLVGDKFSAADVLYATTFGMFGASPMLPKSEVLQQYVKRCLDRPAYARAQAKDAA
jgi:glutathione S-transferase